MPVNVRIAPHERIAYLTTIGEEDPQRWRQAILSVISDPAYQPGFGFLSDRRAQTTLPDAATVRSYAQFLESYSHMLRGCRWAAVSNDTVIFGMHRMFSALVERAGLDVEVFRDYEDARQWLLGRPPSPASEMLA